MFQPLAKKYTRLLLSAVSIIFITYSFVVFFAYCNLLKNDYNDKIAYFSNQQVANAEKTLYLTEFHTKMFSSKVKEFSTGTFQQYEIYQELRRVSSLSLDISGFFLISSDFSYTTSQNDYHLASALLQDHPALFDTPSQDIQWYYLQYTDTTQDALLCTKSILYGDAQSFYTLCVTIPAATILPLPASNRKDSSIFSDHNFSYSILPDSSSVLLMEDISSASQTLSGREAHPEVFQKRIGSSPFTLCMQIQETPLHRMLLFFFLGILLLCGVLFLGAFLTLKYFLGKLTSGLSALSGQFSRFIDTLDP